MNADSTQFISYVVSYVFRRLQNTNYQGTIAAVPIRNPLLLKPNENKNVLKIHIDKTTKTNVRRKKNHA